MTVTMKRLARQWKKSLRPNPDDDDFSLPTIDDARPIDTQEQEEVVRSLEQMNAQQSRIWRVILSITPICHSNFLVFVSSLSEFWTVFAGLLSCYLAFLLFNIYHQAAYPWELVKSPSCSLCVVSNSNAKEACYIWCITSRMLVRCKVLCIWISMYPSLRYHAYFMEDIDSRLVILSDWFAVLACSMAMLGLIRNSKHHRRWIWFSFFGSIVLAIAEVPVGSYLASVWSPEVHPCQLFSMRLLASIQHFAKQNIKLLLCSGAVICLYVDHLLNESSEEVRKLRSYMYAYKAS
ncbi:hypothetical protein Cgig2_022875 [Carnegiea gigantea]|uniref:Uncharacterized protein n=1 Tax=Carnegiea gigantea TaxID=171969 RepID=A0A9Q1KMC0_9CARY|nr:hypothetical protein Cgig2_022875 [Carnegiea gigantea]